jgi:pimeloyl-ACP methyl ester carboxylesterase
MQLHTRDIGEGRPTVLLHGLGSSERDWQAQKDALSATRRVIAIDLRGHGASPPAGDGVTIDDLASDVLETLAARGVDRFDIVGWSLGGLVAAAVAVAAPRQVGRVVLVAAPPGARDASLGARLRLLERTLLVRALPLRWLGAMIARRVFPLPAQEELRRQLATRFADNDPASYRAVFEALACYDDGGVLERITCPVLIVAGTRDYWPVSTRRAQANRLQDGRVVVFDAGHAVPQERPDEFNRIVTTFLDEGERPTRAGAVVALATALLAGACGTHSPITPDASMAVSPNVAADATVDSPAAASRCIVTPDAISCDHQVTPFTVGNDTRDVYWETPTTPPPPGGYPVAVIYQGSLFGPEITWATISPAAPFGAYQQARLQAMLLDQGFTVIAPPGVATLGWQTNLGIPYDLTTDKPWVQGLIDAIEAGTFGPADATHLYAAGISSGGYMTSRMAVSYPGVFRALAIASGSYASCLGPACIIPSTLPANHPPTLFMHGTLDTLVPIVTMLPYHDKLAAQGVDTALDIDDFAGHQWLGDAPERVTAWFESH